MLDERYIVWMLRGAGIVSIVLVLGYIVFLCLIVTHSGQYDAFAQQIISTANGAILGAISTGVVGFWLGTSIGSMLKSMKDGDKAHTQNDSSL